MKCTTRRRDTVSFEVVFLEDRRFPCTTVVDQSSVLRGNGKSAYEVIISTVRSVSGFAMDVLKLGPLCTVNHCPFLNERGTCSAYHRVEKVKLPLDDEFTLS